MRTAVLFAALLLGGCEWFGEESTPVGPPVDAETRERVVSEVFRRLGAAYEEVGPRFHALLPAIKEESVKAGGFADWAEFRTRLEATESGLDVEVSRRITARMRELLTPAPR
ncbi:MAG: hypothetical protein MUE73_21205 [Planctomycetes bacterium]|jgi:hypothetical protein|nr:hypothetical protein [Planctomycetota bacterium]